MNSSSFAFRNVHFRHRYRNIRFPVFGIFRRVGRQHEVVNSCLGHNHDFHLLCDKLYYINRKLTTQEERDVTVLMENFHKTMRSAVMLVIDPIPGLRCRMFSAIRIRLKDDRNEVVTVKLFSRDNSELRFLREKDMVRYFMFRKWYCH